MKNLECPKCRSTPLKSAGRGGTPVLRCYACHGMWVSVEEAEKLALVGTLLDPDSMLPQRASGDAISGLCPSGHGLMIRTKVDLEDPFYLERCTSCGGIWFDAGEWSRLASSHLVHHLRDLWDPAWQRRMRQERLEQRQRDQIRRTIGTELFDAIETLAARIDEHPQGREALGYLLQRFGRA